ncbi:MAG TPA: universal stress protein, partial [Solirubrobacteraceae bacterium]|nr:universal stress protein [Solirubrobacteraceae bacterium]
NARALRRAARLLGEGAVVYALYVLRVPRQLPLEGGMEAEEAAGRAVLESARIAGRRAGVRVKTGLIRTRSPGAALVDEARRVDADLLYLDAVHAPSSEQALGPTATYLLARRPCRIVVETAGAAGISRDGTAGGYPAAGGRTRDPHTAPTVG